MNRKKYEERGDHGFEAEAANEGAQRDESNAQKMRLIRCFRIFFLGLGVPWNADAFQTSPSLAARRNFRRLQSDRVGSLPIVRNPHGAFAAVSKISKHRRVGNRLPEYDRRATSLSNAAPKEAEESDDDNVPTEGKYNASSSDEKGNEGVGNSVDPGNGANVPICRVVAMSDGKIPPLPALSSLSPSSKSLLERVDLLYAARSQKDLRDLAYVSPRSASTTDYGKAAYHHDGSSFDAMENAEGGTNGAANDAIRQEEKLVSILKRSLEDGGFELMDQGDLDLCSALNAGYLLRLSLLPDVRGLDPCAGREFYPELYGGDEDGGGDVNGGKKDVVAPTDELLFGGRVLVFRRGYSRETSTGRLLLPKLDYLQASLVQRSSTGLARRLGEFERRLEDSVLDVVSKANSAVEGAYRRSLRQLRDFALGVVENFGLPKNEVVAGGRSKGVDAQPGKTSDEIEDASQGKATRSQPASNTRGNRKIKFARYRTSSAYALGLDGALAPFLLCDGDARGGAGAGGNARGYFDAPFPAPAGVRLLERVSIQNTVDFFSTRGRRELVKNYFRSSTLVEPAYEEAIVVWRPLRKGRPKAIDFPPRWLYEVAKVFDMEDRLPEPKNGTRDDARDDGPMPLEIRAFYDVPMANIEAVLPKTKLLFRPADAIVFDLFSVVSFLAVAGSLKFDSPGLDLIALVSLVFFAVRTFFRYSNKYARYENLVNKFLTSKLAHRGPDALKYIISEANSNKALRAILVRDWLQKGGISKSITDDQLDDAVLEQAKSYFNDMSSNASQIDVDVMSALDDLKYLNLIDRYDVKEEQEATDSIKKLWNETFE